MVCKKISLGSLPQAPQEGGLSVGLAGHAFKEVLGEQAAGRILLPRRDLIGGVGGDDRDVGGDAPETKTPQSRHRSGIQGSANLSLTIYGFALASWA